MELKEKQPVLVVRFSSFIQFPVVLSLHAQVNETKDAGLDHSLTLSTRMNSSKADMTVYI